MKYSLSKILLLGGFFYSLLITHSDANVVYKDKMVYKVGQTVFSLQDLKQEYQYLNELKCMYDDSLLAKIFSDILGPKEVKNFTFAPNLSNDQKNYFKKFIQHSNLKTYAKSQGVVVDPNVTKYLYLNAKSQNCDLSVFEDSKTFKGQFKDVVSLEIFVRSRFLPTEKANKTTNADLEKAVKSAVNLLGSISKQIDNEFYW